MDHYSENNISPLELLNIYLTDGKSNGDKNNKLYQKFNKELTWDAVLNKGHQINITPLLYHIVKNNLYLKDIRVSHESSNKLKTMYHYYLARNLIQFYELDKILNAFEKENIDVIQLKGAELAKNYYSDQALRPMGDLDLLIRKKDMKRAKESITSQGYQFISGSTFKDEDSFEKKHFHFPYIKYYAKTSIILELHQDIAAKAYFINNDISDFWKNALPISESRRHVLMIPKEYQLLHVFWHTYHDLSKRLYMRLLSLIDIALIIKKHSSEIDWAFVEKKAEEWGIQKQVYFCLYLMNQLLSIDFDKKMMSIKPPSKLSIKIFSFIILKIKYDKQTSRYPTQVFVTLLNLITLNSFYEKFKYLFGFLSNNPLSKRERLSRKYGYASENKIFLYYILDPVVLILNYFKRLLKIFQESNNISKLR